MLITGMSGVGKTSVVAGLRRRGHACIDMDEPGWSYMDCRGHQHWDVERLERVLDGRGAELVFVSGCAEEQAALYRRFRLIILLSAPREVILQRIQSRSCHAFGKDPLEMGRILEDLAMVEPRLRNRCTHEIRTTEPIDDVVESVLRLSNLTGPCTETSDERR